ncbi:hypothetical protein Tco_0610044 [Tanacetum coccineum]
MDNIPLVFDEVASIMNVKVHQEESSTQEPPLLSEPVTAIPKTSTVPVTTVPPTIQPFTSIPQQSTPTPEPTTKPSTTLIPALPDFSSLFGFDHRDIIKDEVKSQLPQILPKEVLDFATPMIQSAINESLENIILAKSYSQPKLTCEAAASLTEFELKKILLDKIHKSKSYQAAREHKELYDALVKSYKLDKDLFESYDSDMPHNQEGNLGNDDEEPMRETPQQGLTQSWLMTLAATADKPSKTFDELMSTHINFSAYIMNGLNITNLTQETLLGPAFKLLKGTRTNFVELEYDFEECYKALSEKLDWDNPESGDYPFDLSKALPLVMNGNRQIVPVDYFF